MAVSTIMLMEMVLFLLGTAFIRIAEGDREHKVHGIVLYPERHSWCQTTAIKQVVASPGYEPATIDNNVCVGACYSYSIPKTQPAEPGELIGPYCDSCQPVETKCYHVTLHADGKNSDAPPTIQKRVQIITNCSCMSCEKIQNNDCEIDDQNTVELPTDLFTILRHNRTVNSSLDYQNHDEIPELLNFSPNKSRPDLDKVNSTDVKLINLLKGIQDGDSSNNDQLIKQLAAIETGPKHDVNLMELINFVNTQNSDDLNVERLKEELAAMRKNRELAEKHRNFGLGVQINEDIDELVRKNNFSKSFGIEGSRLGMTHLKGSHIGMGIRKHNLVSSGDDDVKPNHHVGDEQRLGLDVGHLVVGPHGSLAFAPNLRIEEKLQLDADMVKPNHEGLVLTYENHGKKKTIDEQLDNDE